MCPISGNENKNVKLIENGAGFVWTCRNFQNVCKAGWEFLFYSCRGSTVARWIAINRSIAKLRNTVAITNHRSEWRRGCTNKYENIVARGFRSRSVLTSFPLSVLSRIFHLSAMRAARGFMTLRKRYAIPLRSHIEDISFWIQSTYAVRAITRK